MKRIFSTFVIITALSFSFLTGYFSVSSIPVYAVTEEDWQDLSSNDELVDAFRAYCKERDVTIEGSVSDGVTSFTSDMFYRITNAIGIDLTALQATIKKYTPQNGLTRYLFTVNGITGFNNIFAQFLQDYELEVGDTDVDKVVYSGEYFTDADGFKCLVFYVDVNKSYAYDVHTPIKYGTAYKYTTNQLKGMSSAVYNVTDSLTYNQTIFHYESGGYDTYSFYPTNNINNECNSCISAYDSVNTSAEIRRGYRAIFYNTVDTKYYYGHYLTLHGSSTDNAAVTGTYWQCIQEIALDEPLPDADINIVSPDIKQPLPTSEPIIITAPDNTDNEPEQPDDDWNPVIPDIPDAGGTPSGGNTIDWPDIDLPDFNLPDFSLGDLRLKFPFSIPFDVISLLGVLDSSPVAPVIQEDIPIRIDLMNVDYSIPIDLDMSNSTYDNFAKIVRAVEFIGFCIGLIHLTIRMVKG